MSVHGQGLHAQDDRRYRQAVIDLTFLLNEGAIDGVTEIIRQRRFQIEQGHTVNHDLTTHADGALAQMAAGVLSEMADDRLGGLADPATDEQALSRAGALAAAEIDRLAAEFSSEPATYRCWTEGNYTHHAHKPGDPCPVYGGQALRGETP